MSRPSKPSPMARPGNQNAKKDNPLSRVITIRISPELAQCLQARADGVSIGQQARIDLEAHYGLTKEN